VASTAAVARRQAGCGRLAGRGNGLFGFFPARCVSGFRPVDAQDPRSCLARDRRTSRSPGTGSSMRSLGRLGQRREGWAACPQTFHRSGQSCDPLVARSGFSRAFPLVRLWGGRSARCRCSPPMSPPCSKSLADNNLRGRYLARVWRVLDRRRHERGDVPQRGGSHKATGCGRLTCI